MLMSPPNNIGNLLLKLWPGFENWLKANSILRHGYQGSLFLYYLTFVLIFMKKQICIARLHSTQSYPYI